MGFSELEKQKIKRIVGSYCKNKIPAQYRDQIRVFYKIRGDDVRIIESRPSFLDKNNWTEQLVARMKFDRKTMKWILYWRRASGRWELYSELRPSNDLAKLVAEIEKDPWHTFWG